MILNIHSFQLYIPYSTQLAHTLNNDLPYMNLFWTNKVHTSMDDSRSRDFTRKRRHI